MAEPVTSQFMVFLCTVLTGALAGFLYDVYAGTGQVLGLKKTGTFFGDVIYWLCATVVVYALLLQYNQGEVRFYVLLGLGMGAVFYYRLSRRRMRRLVIKTIQLLIWLVKWIIVILLFPLRIIYIILTYPFKITGLVLGKAGGMAGKMLKRLVPAPVKVLYRRWRKCGLGVIGKLKRKK
ncbi:spore cortex biosynthesis protein YabQ [Desulfallas thermosapovorans]|uniref:Spore cortex biosynthesis protein YabQ n=1 Tax=Desulfallas thermosapovorans DSM 6562 TaxID=1121431 RepID=A0A5S4ZXU9_9FIRM|nr:spore cortex biosynthesis protein YabQ [Desulfallas thermosapovorans]TYO96957.1 spore cortex biosynthesis protein YabQ [Desulfallas thermosapovorans DSM 6562]